MLFTRSCGIRSTTLPGRATRVPRPGRNEPCDCGSDRKYKKCCGRLRAL
ncbi:SEC-C metal-binding domain-containing protein [Candidatus Palauibacter sp.]